MKPNRRPWNAEEHRRFAETCFVGLSQMLAASAKPLLAATLIAAILSGQPTKLIQLLTALLVTCRIFFAHPPS